MKNHIEIGQIIGKQMLSNASKKEQEELSKWLEHDTNKQIFDSIINHQKIDQKLEQHQSIESATAFNKFIKQTEKNRFKSARIAFKLAAASIVIAFISIAVYQMTNIEPSNTYNMVSQSIEPGSSKAVLILSNGTKITLNQHVADTTINQSGVNIHSNHKQLRYQQTHLNTNKVNHNTILTPRGGEYQLALADGTKVWLNAESKLTYPVAFKGAQRLVELEGEAYFEVAHNADKPFIVQTEKKQITVLGTSFNISAYPSDEETTTTLVTGSIEALFAGNIKKILRPNQQLIVDHANNKGTLKQVDTYLYSSWKDGRLVFRNQHLGDILEDMERWYNFRVAYDSEKTKNYRFSIDMPKYDSFDKVIDIIEMTGLVDLEINGNVLIAKSKA